MTASLAVKTGAWIDYNVTPQVYGLANVITVSDTSGTVLKLVVGVILGLSWPCARDILIHIWAWARHLRQKLVSSRTTERASDRVPLLEDQRSTPTEVEIPDDLDITQAERANADPSSSENRLGGGPQPATRLVPKSQENASTSWLPGVFMTVVLAVAAILYALGGGAAGEIPTSTSGLSAASECGIWGLNRDADQRIKDNDDLVQASKENRAAQYGRNCYREQPIVSPDQCDFFQSKQIEYTTEKIDCPFDCPDPDHCICANGIYGSAVQLTTGAVSASTLGLNGKTLPMMKRTSTFVPLDIDYGFVEDNFGDQFQFDYYLGSVNASGAFRNNTFTMFGTPFDWDIPAYSVSAYESTPSGKEYDAWQPISELARPDNTFMTAIFISPCRIIYSGRCDDYIFQANDELLGEGWPPHRYYNQDPRARVLIAIDAMEVCWPDENHCFPPDEQLPENGIEYEMVRNALRRSSSFRSIRYRLGSALVATESISDFESRQLDEQQWIIESQALFNTSLARLQFNMLDIAVGDRPVGDAAAGFEDAYNDTTSSWAKGKMCNRYKFHLPNGYTNINIAETVGLLAIPFILWALSLDEKWISRRMEKPPLQARWMVFDTLVWALILAGNFCYDKSSEAIGHVRRISRSFWGHLQQSHSDT